MARPGHARSHQPLEEAEEAEDPVDAMISRTGCMAQHRELQECMAARQDWRHCQPQVRAFGDCMARRQRAEELHRAPSLHPAHPSPTGE
ncbi:cytochrome c oxidase assembly factor 4 homolog, mitochondrial [Falco peregrinus]|uniref:cytochrome c oxidase assembly factor 4 homolog, mitochondrial n=1 Tax=Falco peregrinus TaxID=8954 RepID=UPI000387192A|nr:cytochrome c oxidase assembly factor 4 homolog, mitochondrial [Falco peregrinus]XP_055658169.1 cytochrome c oxidase assembly factor 4 homolog, mitochondrial [Falco peregrinus]XP_055658170.1 cytochrome c oxidase assembly factor 4 homolog, mitochondrial [Falco peregrinus]